MKTLKLFLNKEVGLIKKIIASFLILFSSNAFTQTKSYFPSLTRVLIDKNYTVYFNFDKNTTRFLNKPCYSLPKNHPVFCDSSEAGETWYLIAKFKSTTLNDSLDIVYSAGPSGDPGFTLTNPSGKFLASIDCTDFYINEGGTIYTSGHTNNMFNQRRKFEIKKDTVMEVKQPFYYVGLKSKTLVPITLYKEKTGKDILAQLPKNYTVEVIASDNQITDFESCKLYLVKTEFGLLGWLRLSDYVSNDQVIEGLFYAGD